MISLIVAMSESTRVIGLDGDMPWKLSTDLKRFKQITTGHTVIMGRKTWESIPEKFRPLPNRRNIVLSKQPEYIKQVPDNVGVCSSFEEAVHTHEAISRSMVAELWRDLFVIGGESLFAEALPLADQIHLTLVNYTGPGDTFFPADPWDQFEPIKRGPREEIVGANGKNSHESRYLILQRKTPRDQ